MMNSIEKAVEHGKTVIVVIAIVEEDVKVFMGEFSKEFGAKVQTVFFMLHILLCSVMDGAKVWV
jgi:hypothetical protein